MSKKNLDGVRIVVTGAARGIGLATAKELHARGATVVLGDLDAGQAKAAAATVGPRASGHAVDVADHDSFARFLAAARADGDLDGLVNNAGIMPIGRFVEQDPAAYRKAVEVNLLGCLHGMHLVLPGMLARGRGHVVNVASTAGKAPIPGGMAYCATKAAVVALTETARVEHAGTGVEFTCVMPNFTNTELIAGTSATKLIPVVEPEDVARAIADTFVHPRKDVFVPRIVGPILRTQPLLGRGIRDLVNRRLGAYDAFLSVDPAARASYDDRITAPKEASR
ncbi:SDR family oxidoreductase [Nocardioides stalactiti]|uniref:SDR family oxidoreductase n=1 Tax=Nocardioides stalactiti TaxID=2755356 RepID=UPI001603633A|nr:SDR family oxidoreductase [Nocardioides stalactiti]